MASSNGKTKINGVLLDAKGQTIIGPVNVVSVTPPPWSPEDVLTLGRKSGKKIDGGKYVVDCGPNGKYKVHGPGDSANIITNSLVAGILEIV